MIREYLNRDGLSFKVLPISRNTANIN